jgi:hypothetical protein
VLRVLSARVNSWPSANLLSTLCQSGLLEEAIGKPDVYPLLAIRITLTWCGCACVCLLQASEITLSRFSLATFLSLLPTQLLNSYLGTTLRSLDEVVEGNSNTGMIIAQVVMMVWVTWCVYSVPRSLIIRICLRSEAGVAKLVLLSCYSCLYDGGHQCFIIGVLVC